MFTLTIGMIMKIIVEKIALGKIPHSLMYGTWTIKCIVGAVVVLSLIECQPDVCRPIA